MIVNEVIIRNIIRDILNEGKHDPNIYKAVIVLGPAGSGKSTIIKQIQANGPGLKYLNSDSELELILSKKLNVPYQQDKRTTDDQKNAFTKYLNNPENEEEFDNIRVASTRKTDVRLEKHYLSGNLGFIIEGTGSSSSSIDWFEKKFKELKEKGYQIYVIGVYTPLDVCIQRNQKRGESGGRGLPVDRIIQTFYGFIGNFFKLSQSENIEKCNLIINVNNSKEQLQDKIKKIIENKEMQIYHNIAKTELNMINDEISLYNIDDLNKNLRSFLKKNSKENQIKYKGR